MGKTLFLGTGNAHKLEEISLLLGKDWTLKSFRDLPAPLEVEETESTLEGNARLKAVAFHQATALPCFADDTGLEVKALDGAPGVYSSRYAGEEGNAEANIAKLLTSLQGSANRSAQFRTVIAYHDSERLHYFEGILRGSIAHTPSGAGGFGYDPIFVPEGDTRSLAEYSPTEKNAISHRGQAVRKLIHFLQQQG